VAIVLGFYDVSIHAPARGATLRIVQQMLGHAVSIHAPARGATGGACLLPRSALGFNPRARAGRDLIKRPWLTSWMVSIHAPARGATSFCLLF